MSKTKPSIAECDRIITAPGQILETEEIELHGGRYRVWKTLPATFREFFLSSLEVYADRTFISSPLPLSQGQEAREHVTFGEVLNQALKIAAWMRSQGLGIRSKVAIGGGNCTGWVVSWIAIHLIGGIAVALNAWLPDDALLHCLKLTSPAMVLMDGERVDQFSALQSSLPETRMYCWSKLSGSTSRKVKSNVAEVSRIPESDVEYMRNLSLSAELTPESDAVIFFTSGTGGRPKAVLSTQRMGLSNLWSGFVAPFRAALRAGLPLPPLPKPTDPQRTVLLSIPLFHVTGNLSWLMRAIHGGSKMVYMRHWNVKQAVKLIMSENVTVIGGVPAVAASLLHSADLPKERDFATVFYGGAPPSKQLAAEVKQRWPKAAIVQGYGMTETNAYVCSVAGGDYLERPESTGPPVPICDIRIVDPESKRKLPTGRAGLLQVRGPQVMKCYYNDDAATKETLDREGWLDTGDAGYIDEEGFLFIKDRLKDIIIRGGENIASQDVENAFYADKRVAEAAAIGVPDERLGELVGVIVSLHPSAGRVTERELLESVKPRLARHAQPAIVFINDGPLQRNVNGKLVKKDLKPGLVKEWNSRLAQKTKAKL